MTANKSRFWWGLALGSLLLLPLGFYLAVPWVYISYSDQAAAELGIRINTQDRILKGWLSPGGTVSEYGNIFPNDDFFMQLDWYFEEEKRRCVGVKPKWPGTYIHIGEDGQVDMSEEGGTDVDRVAPCRYP